MDLPFLLDKYRQHRHTKAIISGFDNSVSVHTHLKGLAGSSLSFVASAAAGDLPYVHLFVIQDKESAAYFLNNLENIRANHKVMFFPSSFKKNFDPNETDKGNVLLRAEVLNRARKSPEGLMIVTYPEALCEKVVTKINLEKNIIDIKTGEAMSMDSVVEFLTSYDFKRCDFVFEPGQFAVRGGIIDIFSFANELPYRMSFSGNVIEAIRLFEPESQLSVKNLASVTIIPDVQNKLVGERRESLIDFLPSNTKVWMHNAKFIFDACDHYVKNALEVFIAEDSPETSVEEALEDGKTISARMLQFSTIEFGTHFFFAPDEIYTYDTQPQPSFNKNFSLLSEKLNDNKRKGYSNLIFADSSRQIERIYAIFEDLTKKQTPGVPAAAVSVDSLFSSLLLTIQEGFIDHDLKIACYTDHQIFDRYHRFRLKESFAKTAAITLKELSELRPGDFVTHIDHGIGKYGGLEKISVNGVEQEALRLVYKDNDILYISIHSLHRIAKYSGKEGEVPSMSKLGSNAWANLKQRTKKRVKDIARDLILLYAKRKARLGFAFAPDTYLQTELEASFIYEDTPDQLKSTMDVKKDMESQSPMDRLICGDVGFGKTEIAIRAAFKAVVDGKQVAILVPTTILALQHFKTFRDRLKDFPCKVDYINRFKTKKEQTVTIKELEEGKVDIIIGTHRLLSKEIKFKDLGLLVIDEEQKFGVSSKEKLKSFKVNVDTLTLTATPIPRTLQFSMMGARDLSIINTPPPNRYPVTTELHMFSEEIIRDAINYELHRGGQVFFVHNRVQGIHEISAMIQKLCPKARISVGHGQMDGPQLEEIMLSFIEGDCDVLVSTTIIESGLDIPNANTIIINDAHMFGLSDMHQMRGRVGRSNKKAFCYLLAPSPSSLTPQARQRLKAIEEFSDLGSGLQIAMRDLDIRGAGNLLGGEQSGFITELGFETYHKILDEAIRELKETDFKDILTDTTERPFVDDCQVDTDLEILIPDHYVENITERLNLYKQLDEIEEDEKLIAFGNGLTDRFGPVPHQVNDLMNTLRLRWVAKKLGFEKIVLKNQKLICYFVSNQESPFYKSESFMNIMKFVQQHREAKIKEEKQKLSLSFHNIKKIEDAGRILNQIHAAAYPINKVAF